MCHGVNLSCGVCCYSPTIAQLEFDAREKCIGTKKNYFNRYSFFPLYLSEGSATLLLMTHTTAKKFGLEPVFPENHEHGSRIFWDKFEGKYYDSHTDLYLEWNDLKAFNLAS